MNQQKLDDVVSHIDYLISELKHLKTKINIEDGIHFNVLKSDADLTFIIEQWDSDLLEPRVLTYLKESPSKEVIDRECMKALNTLGIRAFKKQIYWSSDIPWDQLPEHFVKLDQVYKIEKRELSESLREEIKERINALYSM